MGALRPADAVDVVRIIGIVLVAGVERPSAPGVAALPGHEDVVVLDREVGLFHVAVEGLSVGQGAAYSNIAAGIYQGRSIWL